MKLRLVAILACLLSWTDFQFVELSRATAGEAPQVASPVSPQESLTHLVVPNGLKVELAAHEPQVIDPVAIRFDETGRMWVVEMRDYPTGPTKEHPARSRISVLKDRDDNGFFETATVFADNLQFATGVQPWKGGVFVTMAGQVAYMKDTNGDDKSDQIETWYTGFARKNTQLRANHPRLALDNHIYIANGLRGGTVADAQRLDAKPVSISGMDFRFDPITRRFEAVSGVGQFGLTFDDFGNRFVCTNRNPAIHIVLEDWYIKKNPLVAVAAVAHDVAKAAEGSRLFPIAKSWTTSHLHANQFTAACGVEVYRGDALPPDYRGNIFTCDPTAHLVHREIMQPSGVTFASAATDDGQEFFASRDDWFSPVNLELGPDGALYVVDMYRAVIEHPHWMPAELQKRPDQMLGNDRGRIYRIVRSNFHRPPPPRLSEAPTTSLVEALAHPNAWWRETAARLILERQDQSAAQHLRKMALHHQSALARIHALRLAERLGAVGDDLLIRLCRDSDPRVVEQAIVASESRVSDSTELQNMIAKLADHADARVRFQALLVATPLPPAPKHPTDEWERYAMLIAAGNRGGTVLAKLLDQSQALHANMEDPKSFVRDLAKLAAASKDDHENALAIDALLSSAEFGRVGLSGFFSEISRGGMTIDTLRAKLDQRGQSKLDQVLDDANRVAMDRDQPVESRCEAIDLAAFTSDAAQTLLPLAGGEPNQAVRLRAIAALARYPVLEPWQGLLDNFSRETPVLQRAILDGVFAGGARLALLLDEIAVGRIKPTELDANRIKLLLNHHDATIKSRAEQLLASVVPADREDALAAYRVVLAMKSDPSRGREVFLKRCSTCHRINDVGIQIAPDISDSREKSAEQLLTDIIQPNRAIDSNYFSYTAVTTEGQVQTGVLAAETSNSVTLKQAEGKEVTLRRDQIDELRSDGVSFMPDGLEKDIPPQDMADVISFVKNWRYLEPGQNIPTGH